ncbi:transposase [Nocardia sp. NPDC004750]
MPRLVRRRPRWASGGTGCVTPRSATIHDGRNHCHDFQAQSPESPPPRRWPVSGCHVRLGGRPWTRPRRVLADKGYSTRVIREHLRGRGLTATIPERSDQQADHRRRGSAAGRPPTFDPTAYRRRNVVERCFNRLEQYRAIATRYDTRPRSPTEACSTWPPCSYGFEDGP